MRIVAHLDLDAFYAAVEQLENPELRKQLGVWYTPPEVVKYMVARVDRALRDELALPDYEELAQSIVEHPDPVDWPEAEWPK